MCILTFNHCSNLSISIFAIFKNLSFSKEFHKTKNEYLNLKEEFEDDFVEDRLLVKDEIHNLALSCW